ncbi:MAG: hypothetical protein NT107_14545 [Planctomycetota bacterium]|nr:hypothetical protein [Planctomycetota bacterium]
MMHPARQRCPWFLLPVALLAGSAAAQLPCFADNPGVNLGLGDEAVAVGLPLGFSFPGPAGPVTSISVSDNGFIWLGANSAAGCCNGDLASFLSGGPRIAAAWANLVPGTVQMNTLPASGGMPIRAVVTWSNVAELGFGLAGSTQLMLSGDGTIQISWSSPFTITGHTMLVGVTGGNNAAPGAIDLSSVLAGGVTDTGGNSTVYESFAPSTFDLASRVMSFTPNGVGGYRVAEVASCRPASFISYGRGCPDAPTVYEQFAPGALDLSGRSLRFVPNGAGGFLVAAGNTPPDLTLAQQVISVADDAVVRGIALPFAFDHFGSPVTAIDVTTNGCVYLVPNTIGDARSGQPTRARFFSESASIAALWTDLFPPGGGAVYFDAPVAHGRCYITWRDCPEKGNPLARNTAQLVLESNGEFEIRYGAIATTLQSCLVGYTAGGGALDPGSADLGQLQGFNTGSGGVPVLLAPAPGNRPAIGNTCVLRVTGVPSWSFFGVLLLSVQKASPSVELGVLGLPGCYQHIALSGSAGMSIAVSGATMSLVLMVPNLRGLLGVSVYAQVVLDAPLANALSLITSNGGELKLGM